MTEPLREQTPMTDAWELPTDDFIATLPLDWNHFPVDAQEGWEMLCRAGARYRTLERALAESERKLAEYDDIDVTLTEIGHQVGAHEGEEILAAVIRHVAKLEQARQDALEEAAKMCETALEVDRVLITEGHELAKAIRALASTKGA